MVAVDLFGSPAPVGEIRRLGLPVLEDAAQALGASRDGRRAGALGDAATISFYPSKNLGCLGDGGAIATVEFYGSNTGSWSAAAPMPTARWGLAAANVTNLMLTRSTFDEPGPAWPR